MLSLLLLRHAKSSWDDPALGDFDRPLAPRGEEAALRMGAYMAAHDLLPDLILCSTAQRARQTLKLVLRRLGAAVPTQFADALYLATPAAMLACLGKAGAAQRVMIVGHNPGMHRLAETLAERGDGKSLKALAAKFPTAALAVLTFDVGDWSGVATRGGHLADFMVPKRLP